MAKTDNDLLRAPEAASYLRVSAATLAKWRMNRIGPCYSKIGHLILYSREELSRWLYERRVVIPVSE